MITTKFYLDNRAVKDDPDKAAPIKLVISKKGTTALMSTGVKVLTSQWDKKRQLVVKRENEKKLNFFLSKFKLQIENILLEAQSSGSLAGMSASQVKEYINSTYPKTTMIRKKAKKLSFFSLYIENKENSNMNFNAICVVYTVGSYYKGD